MSNFGYSESICPGITYSFPLQPALAPFLHFSLFQGWHRSFNFSFYLCEGNFCLYIYIASPSLSSEITSIGHEAWPRLGYTSGNHDRWSRPAFLRRLQCHLAIERKIPSPSSEGRRVSSHLLVYLREISPSKNTRHLSALVKSVQYRVIRPKFAGKQTCIRSREEQGPEYTNVTGFRTVRLERLLSFGLFWDVCTVYCLTSTASAKDAVTVYVSD